MFTSNSFKFVFFQFLLSLLTHSSIGQIFYGSPAELQTKLLFNGMVEAGSYAMEANILKEEFELKLNNVRENYWKTEKTKSTSNSFKAEYASLLHQKDIYYFHLYMTKFIIGKKLGAPLNVAQNDEDFVKQALLADKVAGGYMDNGIQPQFENEFKAWINEIGIQWYNQATRYNDMNLLLSILTASLSNSVNYRDYCKKRDLYEAYHWNKYTSDHYLKEYNLAFNIQTKGTSGIIDMKEFESEVLKSKENLLQKYKAPNMKVGLNSNVTILYDTSKIKEGDRIEFPNDIFVYLKVYFEDHQKPRISDTITLNLQRTNDILNKSDVSKFTIRDKVSNFPLGVRLLLLQMTKESVWHVGANSTDIFGDFNIYFNKYGQCSFELVDIKNH